MHGRALSPYGRGVSPDDPGRAVEPTALGAESPSRRRLILRVVLAVAASVALLTLVLPKVVGVPWADVMSALTRPTGRQIALLTLLWAAGIGVHARVLTAALPGLTIRRALTLNLTGSAVANVMPLGGGAGIGVNYLMARRWGFSRGQFSLFTGVVNAWHLGAKGILPAAAVLLLVANDKLPGRPLLVGAAGSGIVLAVVLLAAAAVVTHRGARIAGGAADRVLMLRRPATPPATTARLEAVRGSAIELLRSAWRPMTWGVIASSHCAAASNAVASCWINCSPWPRPKLRPSSPSRRYRYSISIAWYWRTSCLWRKPSRLTWVSKETKTPNSGSVNWT